MITKKGLTYALPDKNKPEPQTNQEDDDKYMNIDEIETQREPDYAAPDEDEVQQYNTYAQVDDWGDGSFDSVPQNENLASSNHRGKTSNCFWQLALL